MSDKLNPPLKTVEVSVQDQLIALQLENEKLRNVQLRHQLEEDAEKEKKKKEEAETREKRRKIHIEGQKQIAAEAEFLKQACLHMKPAPVGGPDTAATYDYDSNLVLVCQSCGSTWKSNEPGFPRALVPRAELIGGPIDRNHRN